MGIKIDVRPEVDKTIYGRLDEAGIVLSTGQNVAITEIEKDDVYICHEPLTPSGETVIFQDRLVKDYNALENLPAINNVKLKGNLTTEDLGINSEDKQVYCEVNVNFNTSTSAVSLRNWVTENPYEVIDEANKKGNPVILKMYLYANDDYMETVYAMQSIYSDTWWGSFKYFLSFVDNETIGYLRLNKNGNTTLGLKKY